jgi:hypothetical protein
MKPALTAALVALLPLAATAQPATAQPATRRINATIASFSNDTLAVRTEDGAVLPILLPQGVRIGALVERSLSDIKPGEFVGSAAMRGRDGRLHAQEVHIFPESLRGTGEGHRPMDLPEQTMTNANVDGIAEAAGPDAKGSRILTLRYPGGEQAIEVGPGIRVVGMVPGDRSLLVPGAAVTIRAAKNADGTLTALNVQAEKDGVKPLP